MSRPVFSVCVYCGARDGQSPAYDAAAEGTGRMLARNGWRLVYGAGDVGIMGALARAMQAAGGTSFGVIPVHLLEREAAKRDLSTIVITETMHERKKVMFMNADAIVMLPGGAGSLDEFFEALTWRQLGRHEKPIIIFNVEGYWDALIALVDQVIAQGFAEPSLRGFLTVVHTAEALEAALQTAAADR